MNETTYEKLRKRVSENLSKRKEELLKTANAINENFSSLGLAVEVWCPEKILSQKYLGGIDAESYLGYGEIEGKWGLAIRTIKRDAEKGTYVGQHTFALESCGDLEILAGALKRIRGLVSSISKKTENQISASINLDNGIEDLKNPNCEF